ncbi:hypothetical protein E4T56_gene4193, partial [Termitomyces sp. T112]
MQEHRWFDQNPWGSAGACPAKPRQRWLHGHAGSSGHGVAVNRPPGDGSPKVLIHRGCQCPPDCASVPAGAIHVRRTGADACNKSKSIANAGGSATPGRSTLLPFGRRDMDRPGRTEAAAKTWPNRVDRQSMSG